VLVVRGFHYGIEHQAEHRIVGVKARESTARLDISTIMGQKRQSWRMDRFPDGEVRRSHGGVTVRPAEQSPYPAEASQNRGVLSQISVKDGQCCSIRDHWWRSLGLVR
jgi:hypothetical protein